ncbi:MAG: ATP synthase F1 subunit gamma [Ruminococcaceae bacterium]|nr:ATP synthase F1 subunit gamma [Oscillospiraceae bacterium]
MAGASINDIKSRIKSVEGTMQITKAMELVATSKLRKAKERAESAKPYLKLLTESISILGDTSGSFSADTCAKTLYIVIAGDRGLAGGYNNNVFKLMRHRSEGEDAIYLPLGKKALDYSRRNGQSIISQDFPIVAGVGVGACLKIGTRIYEMIGSGEIARVRIIYTKFVSMLTQTPVCEDVFPIPNQDTAPLGEPLFEGDVEEMLKVILPQYIGGFINAAVCEAVASECASRRTAMNSANKNAEEMIGSLVLSFNRARQAAITQEITEIVSGAEAL